MTNGQLPMSDSSEICTSTYDEVMPWVLDVLSMFLYKMVTGRSWGPWRCIGSSISVYNQIWTR